LGGLDEIKQAENGTLLEIVGQQPTDRPLGWTLRQQLQILFDDLNEIVDLGGYDLLVPPLDILARGVDEEYEVVRVVPGNNEVIDVRTEALFLCRQHDQQILLMLVLGLGLVLWRWLAVRGVGGPGLSGEAYVGLVVFGGEEEGVLGGEFEVGAQN